jgi:hypothetical protein
VNKQKLRNVLRWGGFAFAIGGYVFGRIAQSVKAAQTARTLIWIGLAMIVGGLVVRMFMSDP